MLQEGQVDQTGCDFGNNLALKQVLDIPSIIHEPQQFYFLVIGSEKNKLFFFGLTTQVFVKEAETNSPCSLGVLFFADRTGTQCNLLFLKPILVKVWRVVFSGCKEWLFKSLWPSKQIEPHILLWPFSSKYVSACRSAAHWIFLSPSPLLCKL